MIDATAEAAELTFAVGRYEHAEALVRAVLEHDRYREASWRLLMRIHAALGQGDKAIDAYRRCRQALGELHLEPSASTARELESLRR
jgi:DNA-binding SARP family transcriptional activator